MANKLQSFEWDLPLIYMHSLPRPTLPWDNFNLPGFVTCLVGVESFEMQLRQRAHLSLWSDLLLKSFLFCVIFATDKTLLPDNLTLTVNLSSSRKILKLPTTISEKPCALYGFLVTFIRGVYVYWLVGWVESKVSYLLRYNQPTNTTQVEENNDMFQWKLKTNWTASRKRPHVHSFRKETSSNMSMDNQFSPGTALDPTATVEVSISCRWEKDLKSQWNESLNNNK